MEMQRDALELAKRFPNDFLQSKLQILNILLTGYTLETKKKLKLILLQIQF